MELEMITLTTVCKISVRVWSSSDKNWKKIVNCLIIFYVHFYNSMCTESNLDTYS